MKKVFGAGAFVSLIFGSASRWLLEGVCGSSNVTPTAPFGKSRGRNFNGSASQGPSDDHLILPQVWSLDGWY